MEYHGDADNNILPVVISFDFGIWTDRMVRYLYVLASCTDCILYNFAVRHFPQPFEDALPIRVVDQGQEDSL